MIYWGNRILTNVKFALGDKCPNVLSTPSNLPAKFPAVSVSVVTSNATADDFGLEENAISCGVSVVAYSKVSMEDSRKILDIADSAMYRMGFKRRGGPWFGTAENAPEVYRVSGRYYRIIGSGETIRRFRED